MHTDRLVRGRVREQLELKSRPGRIESSEAN